MTISVFDNTELRKALFQKSISYKVNKIILNFFFSQMLRANLKFEHVPLNLQGI